MRYRFRLWHISIIGMVIDPDSRPVVISTRIFRWRWMARLYAFPYVCAPPFPGSLCWPEIDEVACTVVNGRKTWEPIGRHSTQITRTVQ
jgi:hypothetical protein